MELTPDKIRENIVVEYYKKGIDFKTTAKALIAFGFAGTTESTVRRIARDHLIIKLLKKNFTYKDIAKIVRDQGFKNTNHETVTDVAKKNNVQRYYPSKIVDGQEENLSERNAIIIECAKKSFSATQTNEVLEKAGFQRISRQRISQILKQIEGFCVA